MKKNHFRLLSRLVPMMLILSAAGTSYSKVLNVCDDIADPLTLDPQKRNAMYAQFHRLVHEEEPYTFLWSPDSLRMFALRVKGLKVHKLGMDWHEWWMGKEEAEKEKQGP